MKHKAQPVYTVPEKRRQREEIDRQIAQFLNAGGQIDIVGTRNDSPILSSNGRRWNDPDDLFQLPD